MSNERKLPSDRDASDEVLESLIADYRHAYVQFLNTADSKVELISNGAAFEIFDKATFAVLRSPCKTLYAIKRKVLFVLETRDLYLMLLEENGEGDDLLKVLLTSFID